MKTLTLIPVILTFVLNLSAQNNVQNTYLDAVKLAKVYKEYKIKPNNYAYQYFDSIFSSYKTDIFSIENNPFFDKKYLPNEPEVALYNQTNGTSTTSSISYSKFTEPEVEQNNFLGTSWESAVINGLSNFMAGRFKAEVVQMGLQNTINRIQKDDSLVVATLFPKTFQQINILYQGKTNSFYTADLMLLRQLVLTDLQQIPENVIQSDLLLKNIPDASRDLLTLGNLVVKYSRQGFPLDRIFEKLPEQQFRTNKVQDITSQIHLFSEALKDTSLSKTNWVNPLTRLNFKNNNENLEARFFYGLLYEQLKQSNSALFHQLPSNSSEKIAESLQETLLFVNTLNDAYSLAKTKEFKFSSVQEYLDYALEITSAINTFLKKPAILDAYDLHSDAIAYVQKYLSIISPFLKKDYQSAIPILIVELGNHFQGDIKYIHSISFLAQLAEVNTDKDLENLLNAYALPIGSSSIKRNSQWNFSVNGYVGLTGGREKAFGETLNQTKWNVGLTAPVGFSLTYRDFTAFASIIDLGTMVNLRINNDETSYSGLKFEHFLAPGFGVYYNVRHLPISIGVHYSYISNLRNIKYFDGTAEVTESGVSVSRFNASILIDIPFFTLYNKERN